MGIFSHSDTFASEMRPGVLFQFIPNVFSGVQVWALCGPVKFFHTSKPFLYRPHFVHKRHYHAETEKALSKLLPEKLEAHNSLDCRFMPKH